MGIGVKGLDPTAEFPPKWHAHEVNIVTGTQSIEHKDINRGRRPSCLGGLDSLPDDISPLLLEQHDVEAGEVVQFPSLLNGDALLCPGRLVPLLNGTILLHKLLHDTRSSSTREAGDDEFGEGEMLEREGLAGNTCGGSIDDSLFANQKQLSAVKTLSTHPILVDDLNDHGDTACAGAGVEEDEAADLDETLEVGFTL